MTQASGKPSINQVINKLHSLYNDTHPKIIRADVREMIFSGLIYPYIDHTEYIVAEKDGRDYPIQLTKLGKLIMRVVIKRAIYYEIVCDDTPIDSAFINDQFRPLNRYDSTCTLGEYIIRKTYSIIYFLLYLERIEAEEKKRWNEKILGQFKPIFTNQLIKEVKNDIFSYVFKYVNQLRNKKRLIQEWKNYFEISD